MDWHIAYEAYLHVYGRNNLGAAYLYADARAYWGLTITQAWRLVGVRQ